MRIKDRAFFGSDGLLDHAYALNEPKLYDSVLSAADMQSHIDRILALPTIPIPTVRLDFSLFNSTDPTVSLQNNNHTWRYTHPISINQEWQTTAVRIDDTGSFGAGLSINRQQGRVYSAYDSGSNSYLYVDDSSAAVSSFQTAGYDTELFNELEANVLRFRHFTVVELLTQIRGPATRSRTPHEPHQNRFLFPDRSWTISFWMDLFASNGTYVNVYDQAHKFYWVGPGGPIWNYKGVVIALERENTSSDWYFTFEVNYRNGGWNGGGNGSDSLYKISFKDTRIPRATPQWFFVAFTYNVSNWGSGYLNTAVKQYVSFGPDYIVSDPLYCSDYSSGTNTKVINNYWAGYWTFDANRTPQNHLNDLPYIGPSNYDLARSGYSLNSFKIYNTTELSKTQLQLVLDTALKRYY